MVWLTNSIKNLRKEVRSPSLLNWESYGQTRKEYKSEIQNSKRNSWRDFCESGASSSATSRLRKAVAKETHYQVGALQLLSDYTDSDEEAAKYHLQVNILGLVSVQIT